MSHIHQANEAGITKPVYFYVHEVLFLANYVIHFVTCEGVTAKVGRTNLYTISTP